ncbi:MAG: mechanosensitive ion channel family protein [Salaquimonas sp.]|nr:mechanosensitive ion channel family protein [Salaquimonas sp.]
MIRHGIRYAAATLLLVLCLMPACLGPLGLASLGLMSLSVDTAFGQTALLKAVGGKGEKSETLPKSVESLVEQARKDGFAVVVISPQDEKAADSGPDMSSMMTEMGLTARQKMKRILANAPNLFTEIGKAITTASPDGTFNWLFIAVGTSLLGILIGFLPARAIQYWGREHFRAMYNPHPADNAEKIGYLYFRASLYLLNTVLLFGVAVVVAIVLDYGHVGTRSTIFVIISSFAAWRIARRVILQNLFAPDVPSHRMLTISDEDAWKAYREWRWVLGITIAMFGVTLWLERIHAAQDSVTLGRIVTSLAGAILLGIMFYRHRRIIGGAVLGKGDPQDKPAWRRFHAASWYVWANIYLAVAWAFYAFRLALGVSTHATLIIAPPAAVIGGLAAYGLLLLIIERFYRMRRENFERKLRIARKAEEEQRRVEEAAREEAQKDGIAEGEEQVENLVTEPKAPHGLPQYRALFKPLMQQTAAVVVAIAALGFVLAAWDIRAGSRGNPVTAFMDTLFYLLLAWVLYRAVDIYVAAKLADEHAAGASPEAEEEPGGHGTSRLGTLLPIIRLAAKTTIVVIAGMIVLSNLGVDIAPLFAGAGVIGLAVGFGAQTLIRDIFSGGFFLFDDAFRKGEYIELGNIRGTVEKISLRSFQLRHHNGPLHTIPFGEIKQLTNYSRDWVIMKLPLRLTFDTDIEKVRKLVKKLGEELLNHPEVGKNFLQPLKSQGVVQMDDSALILRVKFMTKPGDQWVTRKVVYASVQELFHREGIHFANREVTVRIADAPHHPLTEEEKETAAAAAARLLQDEDKSAPSGDDR